VTLKVVERWTVSRNEFTLRGIVCSAAWSTARVPLLQFTQSKYTAIFKGLFKKFMKIQLIRVTRTSSVSLARS